MLDVAPCDNAPSPSVGNARAYQREMRPLRDEIGVCSWSFESAGPGDLARACHEAGVRELQLGLGVLLSGQWSVAETMEVLDRAGVRAVSGMITTLGEDYSTLASIRETGGIRLDDTWPANLEMVESAAVLAERLFLELVTMHAGFLPSTQADGLREKMVGRVRQIADRFAAHGIALGLETGQETAETLLSVLEELSHPGVCVNFDPANMILYGAGAPVAALDVLAGSVRQIHVKDARAPSEPGAWGKEVVVGTGDVDWPSLLAVINERRISCNFMIERYGGASVVDDVARTRVFLERLLGTGD